MEKHRKETNNSKNKRTVKITFFFFNLQRIFFSRLCSLFCVQLNTFVQTSFFPADIRILWTNTKITRFSHLQTHMVLFNFFQALTLSEKNNSVQQARTNWQVPSDYGMPLKSHFSDENLSAESVLDSWLRCIS